MKILLCDKINDIAPDVQVIYYTDGQSFSDLGDVIKQKVNDESFDFAIVLNDTLAEIIPLLGDFFKESNCLSISFYGDNFQITKKYIDYFKELQQNLSINIFYADRRGFVRNVKSRGRNAIAPFSDIFPEWNPSEGINDGLFNECNTGCPADKAFFINATPNVSHKLYGDLIIDNADKYIFPIKLDNGIIFDGCGHTITLTSDKPVYDFMGFFDLPYGSILNLTIRVNTKNIKLGANAGWLCIQAGYLASYTCLIDNCHVYAKLHWSNQGGLIGPESFSFANDSIFMIQNCSFSGDIDGIGCGGIVAENCFNDNLNTTITMQDCRFFGRIYGSKNGGMTGNFCFNRNEPASIIKIQNCCADGYIIGDNNGGVIGPDSFFSNENIAITIHNCRFSGNINGFKNAGITGFECFCENKKCSVTIYDCCASGDIIGELNGGAIGAESFKDNTELVIIIQNCHFSGDMWGNRQDNIDTPSYNNSGLIGAYSFENTEDKITIRNCSFAGTAYSLGNGLDKNSGIVGSYNFKGAKATSTITIDNCVVSGEIDGGDWGGIVGIDGFKNAQSENMIQNCYSLCNFTVNANNYGGILGAYSGSNATKISINNCYSTGTNLGQLGSYAIVGTNSENCTVSNCIYNSYYNTDAGPQPKNIYRDTYGTPNIAGRVRCNRPDTVQIIYALHACPLNINLLNKCSYKRRKRDLKVVAACSICEPIAVCNIITFVFANVCRSEQLYIYSKDMEFKSRLYWDNNNLLYNGTLASGTYFIAAKKH